MKSAHAWKLLQRLDGIWEGSGRGEFPTIEKFDYRETLTIRAGEGTALEYEQRTWRDAGEGEVPSHHEIGFIGVADDGSIAITSAQGLDRLEAMSGTLEETLDGFVLTLASTALAHDDRMIRSWRNWVVSANHLHYDMGMATRSTPGGAHHLAADLYLVST